MKTNKTNKVSFTPGPWKVLEIKNDKELMFVVKSDERMIGSFHGFYSDADDKLKADANLLAAAPEMFEMLETILNETDDAVWITKIESIINKAKGE